MENDKEKREAVEKVWEALRMISNKEFKETVEKLKYFKSKTGENYEDNIVECKRN